MDQANLLTASAANLATQINASSLASYAGDVASALIAFTQNAAALAVAQQKQLDTLTAQVAELLANTAPKL